MNMRNVVLGVVCVAMFCASSGLAGEGKHKGRGNKHGKGARFKALDADSDGVLSLEEFKAMQAKRLAKMKEKMGDEFDSDCAADMPSPEDRFAALDKDDSGTLTKQELWAGHKKSKGKCGKGEGGKAKGACKEDTPEAPAEDTD